ncbi:unnamed protein product [Toxocara canis]|uniref:Shootin-1 n=1 Tax=Toxocara canis TaxID=6265 RepID=A0A183V0R5_TOXCA|nr:unnamed protein product [Toxocara canis]
MFRRNLGKKESDQPKKRETTIGSAMTPDRTPSVRQLRQQLEKQERDHSKRIQEMCSFYEEKLIRFDAMQVRYMAAREHQETLFRRIKKLENELADMQRKKECIEAELNNAIANKKSVLPLTEKSSDLMNESDAVKWIENDKRYQDMKERCARFQKELANANELIAERDETIAEFEKRVDALRQIARELPLDNSDDPIERLKVRKRRLSKEEIDIRQGESSDSDSEYPELLVIIDEIDDEEVSNSNIKKNNREENTESASAQNGRGRAASLQQRKKAVERKLDDLTSYIITVQRRLQSYNSELKTKLASECELQRRVKKLQLMNAKLEAECEQMRTAAIEKPFGEVTKLAERLRDLEVASSSATTSLQSCTNAFDRINVQKNEYKAIISSSIEEIDKLCQMVKQYLHTARNMPSAEIDLNTTTEADDHLDETPPPQNGSKVLPEPHVILTPSTECSETPTSSVNSREAAMRSATPYRKCKPEAKRNPFDPEFGSRTVSNASGNRSIGDLSGLPKNGRNNTDSSFTTDCSIITLDKTCFIPTVRHQQVPQNILQESKPVLKGSVITELLRRVLRRQPELFKEPAQMERFTALETSDQFKQLA